MRNRRMEEKQRYRGAITSKRADDFESNERKVLPQITNRMSQGSASMMEPSDMYLQSNLAGQFNESETYNDSMAAQEKQMHIDDQ